MPQCPRSSGPLRKELGRFGFISAFRHGRAKALLSRLPRSSSTCGRERQIILGRALGADKAADLLGILDTGGALVARGHVDAAGAGDPIGLRDIIGVEAT